VGGAKRRIGQGRGGGPPERGGCDLREGEQAGRVLGGGGEEREVPGVKKFVQRRG